MDRFELLSKINHKGHSFGNRTILITLYAYDSLNQACDWLRTKKAANIRSTLFVLYGYDSIKNFF